jgi:hypothetical protein
VASLAFRVLALLFCAACASPGAGPVVLAPSAEPAATGAPRPPAPPAGAKLTACTLPWTLEDMQGDRGKVIVTCGTDVNREDLGPGPLARAIEPVLEPGRQRVCACAMRMPVPAFVDLVVTSSPDEGRASLEVGELDDELDHDVATAFKACVGQLTTAVPRTHIDACQAPKAILTYPLRVDLAP